MADLSASDEYQKWRDLVGGFILAFGDIELITHQLWREYFEDQTPPVFFKERTSKLMGQLRHDEEANREIISALTEALRIADKRNTVAHNPMQVQVFEHSKTGELFFEQAISSATNDDYIDDLELMELRGKAEQLVSQLYMKIGFGDKRQNAKKK